MGITHSVAKYLCHVTFVQSTVILINFFEFRSISVPNAVLEMEYISDMAILVFDE